MEIISSKFVKDTIDFKLDEKTCFLDIETTGFSRSKNHIYLIGLLYQNSDSSFSLDQYVTWDLEEKSLLEAFLKDLTRFNKLITYNGDSFDIPFIREKLDFYGLDKDELSSKDSLDIYRYIRSNRDFLKLKNYRLKTIERSLGIVRKDTLDGGQCIDLYFSNMKEESPKLKEEILGHNFDDLYYLVDVLKVKDLIDKNRKISLQAGDIFVDKIDIKGDFIQVCTSNPGLMIFAFEDLYSIETSSEAIVLDIQYKVAQIPGLGRGLFIDLLDLNLNIKNSPEIAPYVPENTLILSLDKEPITDNIKNLIESLIASYI